MVVARLFSRVVDLVTMLVLARLLSPKDFGLVAIAMTVILIVEAALELPLSQALVRLPEIKPQYFDTAFTLGIMRGSLLCAIVCSISVPFAAFYGQPKLVALICVLSLAPAARGLLNPRMAQYAKDLNFKWEFLFELVGKLVAFAIGMAIALWSHSYWSIAAVTVVAPLVIGAQSYFLVPFKPRLTLADWRIFGDFLGWMSVSQMVMALTWQSDQLLLGKLTKPAQLGLFTTSSNLASIPMLSIFAPILRPLLSAFSALKEDQARLAASYQSAASAVVAIGLPLMVGESLVAAPIVHLMLGDKWLGAIPMLHWLALSLVPSLFAVPLTPLVMSLNKTKMLVWRNLFEMCIKLPCVITGAIMFGFAGVIGARIISETLTVAFCMFIVRRLLGIPVLQQLTNCWRGVAAVAVMAAVLTASAHVVDWGPDVFGMIATLGVQVMLGAVTYCGALAALWRMTGKPPGLEATAARILGHYWQRIKGRPHQVTLP
jgi:PST family polysaccharide transporter